MAAGSGSGNLFMVTCGNMRQYLQEHPLQQPQRQQEGSLACWLRLAPATEGPGATGDGTLPLFPARPDKAPQLSQDLPEAKEKAPMTILFKGRVHLFEDVPTDKAQKLMQLAGTWSASQAPEGGPSSTGTVLLKRAADLPLEELLEMSDLRKASVQRFLSNRQCRNPADVPYERVAEEKEAPDFKAVNDEPSLCLKL